MNTSTKVQEVLPGTNKPLLVCSNASLELVLDMVSELEKLGLLHVVSAVPKYNFEQPVYGGIPIKPIGNSGETSLQLRSDKMLPLFKELIPGLLQGAVRFDLILNPLSGDSAFRAMFRSDEPIGVGVIVPYDPENSAKLALLDIDTIRAARELEGEILVNLTERADPRLKSRVNDFVRASLAHAEKDVRLFHPDSLVILHGFAAGRVSLVQAIDGLVANGCQTDTAGQWMTDFMAFARHSEVIDTRPLLTPRDRFKLFQENRDSLSESGLEFVQRMEGLLSAQQDIAPYLPTVSNPHLEYFKPLSHPNRDVQVLIANTASLRLTEGCSHSCHHCYFNPSGQVTVIPFFRIAQLLSVANESFASNLKDKTICPYHDSEPTDYYDPTYDADIADVVRVILEKFPEQKVHITTRGGYPGDQIAQRALIKLGELARDPSFADRLDIRVSVDLFDTRGDLAAYTLRMVNVFKCFQGVRFKIANASGEDQQQATHRLIESIANLAEVFSFKLEFGDKEVGVSKGEGSRAAKHEAIDSSRFYDVADCMYGYHIFPDGRVLLKSHVTGNGIEGIKHSFSDSGFYLWDQEIPTKSLKPSANPKRLANERGAQVLETGLFYRKAEPAGGGTEVTPHTGGEDLKLPLEVLFKLTLTEKIKSSESLALDTGLAELEGRLLDLVNQRYINVLLVPLPSGVEIGNRENNFSSRLDREEVANKIRLCEKIGGKHARFSLSIDTYPNRHGIGEIVAATVRQNPGDSAKAKEPKFFAAGWSELAGTELIAKEATRRLQILWDDGKLDCMSIVLPRQREPFAIVPQGLKGSNGETLPPHQIIAVLMEKYIPPSVKVDLIISNRAPVRVAQDGTLKEESGYLVQVVAQIK